MFSLANKVAIACGFFPESRRQKTPSSRAQAICSYITIHSILKVVYGHCVAKVKWATIAKEMGPSS